MTSTAFAQTNAVTFRSAETQTALLELYTSEGCSSCPPAELWLSKLKDSPRLWQDFVPVAFHVDYWDHLGWRDPWGSGKFADRQRDYAALWHNIAVYTPGFVLEGKEWGDWSGVNAPPASKAKSGVLTATSTDKCRWQISFAPVKGGATYEVHAALLGNNLSSNVKAGENNGRKLKHDFVVLDFANASLTAGGQGELTLNPPNKQAAGSLALAVWVTESGKLEPLQATGGWLSSADGK